MFRITQNLLTQRRKDAKTQSKNRKLYFALYVFASLRHCVNKMLRREYSKKIHLLLIFQFFLFFSLKADLLEDLLIVEQIDKELNRSFPVTYNNFLEGGYINMPSARAGNAGEIAAGYSHLPPYRIFNVRVQPYSFLEFTGNYRVFHDVPDPVMGASGYGDFSERGINVKFILLRSEDSNFGLPGVAVGFNDFLGTCGFRSEYVVFTQVFPKYHFEVSLGYGLQRLKGLFGGIHWCPWENCENSFLRGLSFLAEYDASDYHKDPHPEGRKQRFPLNGGIKYSPFSGLDFNFSYVRGNEFAFSTSIAYNLGESQGFVPKYRDPLPYCSPVNNQKVGELRPYSLLLHELALALEEQGFKLIEAKLESSPCEEKILHLHIANEKWILMQDTSERLSHLLSSLAPSNLDEIIVTIICEGFACQRYRFRIIDLINFREHRIGLFELMTIAGTQEVETICSSEKIFYSPLPSWEWILKPKIHNYFGSSTGKYKYAIGLQTGAEGYIKNAYYYKFLFGWIAKSTLCGLTGMDRLNPSQIINVHSDIMLYQRTRGVTLDIAYLQRGWNLGRGWYTRGALGCFERAYGGLAAEWLYYPVDSILAIGFEAAVLRKRTHDGFGFTDKVRKLKGFTPSYIKFLGSQYFIDLYYDCQPLELFFKVSGGKFLANDWGARFEATRYFDNGVELTAWYTVTNGNDKVNGERYFNKGIAFSIPLEIFYTYSSRERWNYQMAAWTRDVGYRSCTGNSLYDTIRWERE